MQSTYVVAASHFHVSPFEEMVTRVFETDDTTAGIGFFTNWLWRETERLVEEGIFRGNLQVGFKGPFHPEIRFAASRGKPPKHSALFLYGGKKRGSVCVSGSFRVTWAFRT